MSGLPATRVLVIVAAFLVLLGGGAAATWWLSQGTEAPGDDEPQADQADGEPPAATDEVDPLAGVLPDALGYEDDAATAHAAASALAGMSSDADVDERLAAGTRQVIQGVDGALPAGTVLTPREETWARRGNLAAMLVEVQPPGVEAPDVFLVWLVRDPQDEEVWLLSSTELLEGSLEEPNVEGAG